MKIVIFILQTTAVGNYEDLGVKSILIGAIVALAGVVVYLYRENGSLQKESKEELKKNSETMLLMYEKYHQFTESLKELLRNGKL